MEMRKRNSLYVQLLMLLVLAGAITVIFFCAIDFAGSRIVDNYYTTSDYTVKKDTFYIDKLQKYVTKQEIAMSDTTKITEWVNRQKVVWIQIYQDYQLIYDSDNPQKAATDAIYVTDTELSFFYKVKFADGEGYISIYGVYDYQIYNYVLVAELFISFLLFLFIVIVGIRRKMKYIQQLSREIEILEGGNLDYSITVSGKDELSDLAYGLDCMRHSFREQVEAEANIVQENHRIITEMSHDLRTPITSLMLYAEILKKGKYKDQEQMREYLDKIEDKASQMKQLTDHLFKYALVTGEEAVKLEKPVTTKEVFYDFLSEMSHYLEQKGFQVQNQIRTWPTWKISVNIDFMVRIMDNVTSNLIKYADVKSPIVIKTMENDAVVEIIFENKIISGKKQIESNGVGIRSIKHMMMEMNGTCRVEQNEDTFTLSLVLLKSNNTNS